MSDERDKKIAKAAIKAAKEMLQSLPDDQKLVMGREVFTGKEVKEKFEADDEFAAKTAEQVLKLKLDTLIRKKKTDDK